MVTAERSSTAPPSSSGTPTIVSPSSLAWASSSGGVAQASSAAWAAGRSLASAKSRTDSRSICCSSVGREVEQVAAPGRGWRAGLDSFWAAANVRPARAAVRTVVLEAPCRNALGGSRRPRRSMQVRCREAVQARAGRPPCPRRSRFCWDIGGGGTITLNRCDVRSMSEIDTGSSRRVSRANLASYGVPYAPARHPDRSARTDRRGRAAAGRGDRARAAARGDGGRPGARRDRRAGQGAGGALRRARARPRSARGARRRRVPRGPRRAARDRDPDADRGRRARGPRRGPVARRRRLPAQAVSVRRAGRADPRARAALVAEPAAGARARRHRARPGAPAGHAARRARSSWRARSSPCSRC